MEKKLTLPTVHLNGSSREDLMTRYSTALAAVSSALDACYAASPHGRDYYVQEHQLGFQNAFYAAYKEHTDRLRKLTEVRDELKQIYSHVRRDAK
jgi:hypothetical protein